jgi:hypothetical protein
MPKMLCPQCGVGINVPDRYAGKRVRCPKCQAEFLVPAFFEEQLGGPSEGSAEQGPFEPPSPFARPSSIPEFPQGSGAAGPEPFEPPSPFEHERQLRAAKKGKARNKADDRPASKLGLASLTIGVCTVLTVILTIALARQKSHHLRWEYSASRVTEVVGDVSSVADITFLLGLVLAIAGVALAVTGLAQKNCDRRPAVWGLILNGVPLASLLVLLISAIGG